MWRCKQIPIVSIPFRGFHGDNMLGRISDGRAILFQSPFGDSMGITRSDRRYDMDAVFQSPFGDSMGITKNVHARGACTPFQSPFGDSMGITCDAIRRHMPEVSIPFRGFHGDNFLRYESPLLGLSFQSPFGDSMGITRWKCGGLLSCSRFNPLSGIPWG